MNKLLRVLISIEIFLGLGISCASATNFISFDPQAIEVNPGSSQNVQIMIDEVPNGLSGFNITISVLDPEIAEIIGVSSPGWNVLPDNSTSTVPSNFVWIKALNVGKVYLGDTNVLLGTINLIGKKAGSTDLNIQTTKINADNGSLINPFVITGKVYVLDNESTVINYSSLNNSKLNKASNTAGNTAERTANYSAVTPAGSLVVGVAPKTATVSTSGTAVDYTIKIKSLHAFDDVVRVNLTMDSLPENYKMPLEWFDWNNQTVDVASNSTISLPLRLTIPPGQSAGTKSFKVRANSTLQITNAFDSGIITIS